MWSSIQQQIARMASVMSAMYVHPVPEADLQGMRERISFYRGWEEALHGCTVLVRRHSLYDLANYIENHALRVSSERLFLLNRIAIIERKQRQVLRDYA